MDTESKATKLHYIPGCIKWKKPINTPTKKDQCSLCINYHPGSDEVKRELQGKFDIHVGEKEKVRELKNESKKKTWKMQAFFVLRLIYNRSCTYRCLVRALFSTKEGSQITTLPSITLATKTAIFSFGMKHKANVGHQRYQRLCTQLCNSMTVRALKSISLRRWLLCRE